MVLSNKDKALLVEFLLFASDRLHLKDVDYLGLVKAFQESKQMCSAMCEEKQND